jgi:predicted membrane protein
MSESNSDYNEELKKKRFTHGGVYASHGGPHSHVVFGIIVLLLGILFLLENLGIFYVRNLWNYWPVILIGIGIAKLFDAAGVHDKLWEMTLAVAGVIFLANNLGYLPWNLWNFLWPGLLILWGLTLLMRGAGIRGGKGTNKEIDTPTGSFSTISNNILKEEVVFGGINRKVQAQDFQGGKVAAVFGGVEIDLRGSTTTRDEIQIEVNAVFGGVELTVPDTWDVTVRGSGVLGGYEDKTRPAPATMDIKRPRLIVRGGAVFGGVTVRN